MMRGRFIKEASSTVFRRGLVLAALCLFGSSLCAQDWKFDVVHLKNGFPFEGLILSESREGIQFQHVVRKPGQRTFSIATSFTRDEIDRIERLGEADRKELAARLAMLDQGGQRERERMKRLRFTEVAWANNESARQYTGHFFTLTSNARDDIVRQAVVRLEDVFRAYTERLGTRRQPAQPLQIILLKSLGEYQASLQAAGLNILNPAYFDPIRNQIVAASDLEARTVELDQLRQKHESMLQDLDSQEKKLRKHFNGQPPPLMIAQLRQTRRNILLINSENESTFERLSHPLFTTLYHEAFHAYLENFVYPSAETLVPRWLNEGLAQIFETALVETGELRVGHIDVKRLSTIQDAVRQKRLLSLTELLGAESRQFQVAHRSEALRSDRHFQASWALAYYLTFDRGVLGSSELDQYVQSLHRGTDRLQAFRDLVGQPIAEFEAQFHQYLVNLRPDGTLKKP